MKSIQSILHGVMFVGQIGFSAITPPLVLVYLAHLAVRKFDWGEWVIIAAIIVGIITAFSGVYRIVRLFLADEKKETTPRGRSFNEHL